LQELQKFWTGRSRNQRLAIIGGFVVSFVLVLAFVALAGRVQMALLYAGLDDAQAAPIVAHLEQGGVAYQLRGGTIWVDQTQRDRVRMDLAARNLPQQGGPGYEILDEMSGFSTTSQMFDAAYWRAKEGELARTILSIPSIRSARVHLTAPQSRGYRDTQPGSASVTVVTDGTPLTAAQADAMRFLISSAVPKLAPEAVSVIDSARGVIQPQDEQGASEREDRIKENVERILAPHVGAGNAIVEVSVDLVTETEQVTERSFDPTQRAMISQETEELSDESSMAENAAVTAASNLPERADQSGERQQSQRAETRQRANYEVGSLTRQIERHPGAVRRLSVAVLVNGTPQEGADGVSRIVPRPEPELSAIRDLVAAAVGFDAQRGDEITVKSMPFVAETASGTEAVRGGLLERLALDSLVRLLVVGLFALLALMLTLRALRNRASEALDASQPLAQLSDMLDTPPMVTPPMLPMAEVDLDFTPATAMALPDDPVARLKQLMKERQDETVRLLNGWIGSDERTAP